MASCTTPSSSTASAANVVLGSRHAKQDQAANTELLGLGRDVSGEVD